MYTKIQGLVNFRGGGGSKFVRSSDPTNQEVLKSFHDDCKNIKSMKLMKIFQKRSEIKIIISSYSFQHNQSDTEYRFLKMLRLSNGDFFRDILITMGMIGL